ncbi:hypothetical protein BCR42DRAFT_429785, partial [Absidia repens]
IHRLPIASQQLYLVTHQHILTLAISIIHLFHNTLFYSFISNSTNNPLSSTIIYHHRNLLFQHPLPLTFTIKTHCHSIQ